MNRIVTRTVVLLSGALVAACSGGDGAGGSDPAAGSTQSTALGVGGHGVPQPWFPPVTVVDPPPPPSAFPTPVACPAGTTCAFTALSLAPPISTCTSPWWFAQSGATASAKMVMACSYTDVGISMLNTWVSHVNTAPGDGAAIATSQAGLPNAAAGVVYVTFLPPTPTAFPDPSTGQPTTAWSLASPPSWLVDASGAPLPCTKVYEFLTTPKADSAWGVYCVETPAVEAWGALTGLLTPTWGPYGFAYLGGALGDIIGGSCSTGCTNNIPIVPGPIGPPGPAKTQ